VLKRIDDTSPQRFNWKWRGDEAGFTHAGLGDPLTDTQYTLCVYDTTSSVPTLAAWINFLPDYWIEKPGKSWRWRARYGNSGSIDLMIEASAVGDLPRVRFRHGVIPPDTGFIPLPVPVSGSAFFHQAPSVSVLLVNSDGLCMKSSYAVGDTTKNDGGNFVAKTP
jgi:hypothetical protein